MTNEEKLRDVVVRWSGHSPEGARLILAAIVAELGITREMVDYCEVRDCVTAADALATLLDASGAEP